MLPLLQPLHFLDELVRIVGAAHVLNGSQAHSSLPSALSDLAPYLNDARGRYTGQAIAVVHPADTQEVAQIVRLCHEHGIAIVPQGGNTGLVRGGLPDTSGTQLVLSLARLNQVVAIDVINGSLTAQAGCTLQSVQEAAQEKGLLFPLSLASEGSCTIGGNLATNAGGTQVLRYGNARDLCLGLEVVTAQGKIWQGLSTLRKDNRGYKLRDCFIGSEGTLGLITAATLRLFPLPSQTFTLWLRCLSLEDVLTFFAQTQAAWGSVLTTFELIGPSALALLARHHGPHRLPLPLSLSTATSLPPSPWDVLLELSFSPAFQASGHSDFLQTLLENWLSAQLEKGFIQEGALAQNTRQSQDFWALRESLSPAQAQEGPNIKNDVSVPISQLAVFVRSTEATLTHQFPGVRLICFGHVGDGNLHFNVQAPVGEDPRAFNQAHEAEVHALVNEQCLALGGSWAAEHGVGAMKANWLEQYSEPVALELMRQLKQALDPQGILNPGKVLNAVW
jgi:FAD/FMN-containing dehydrogenase